jgi:hypothetical protein
MAAYTIRGSNGVLVHSIDRSVERRSIHLVMGAGQSSMTFLAGFWFFRLLGIEGMRGMATITLVLNCMAAFAKCLSQRSRKSSVLRVLFHALP